MRTRLRHLLAAALAAVTIVTVSACAAIPTDGPVRAGQTIKDESLSGVDYRPDKPVSGADQTAILRGFIAAGTGIGWATAGADIARYSKTTVRAG
ncbi:hypothetical protein IAE22_32765, partial [Bacillus sp. S34]|nr:hypothetical protein [Bacillus sp. S34]